MQKQFGEVNGPTPNKRGNKVFHCSGCGFPTANGLGIGVLLSPWKDWIRVIHWMNCRPIFLNSMRFIVGCLMTISFFPLRSDKSLPTKKQLPKKRNYWVLLKDTIRVITYLHIFTVRLLPTRIEKEKEKGVQTKVKLGHYVLNRSNLKPDFSCDIEKSIKGRSDNSKKS